MRPPSCDVLGRTRAVPKHVGAQFVSGNACHPLDVEDTKRGDSAPLRKSLRGYANSRSQLVAGPRRFNRFLQSFVTIRHGKLKPCLNLKVKQCFLDGIKRIFILLLWN